MEELAISSNFYILFGNRYNCKEVSEEELLYDIKQLVHNERDKAYNKYVRVEEFHIRTPNII